MFVDAYGNDVKIGDYVVYAATTGIRIGRISKYTIKLSEQGLTTRTSIRMRIYDPSSGYSWHKWYEITVQPSRCYRLNPAFIPKEIQSYLG